jgi:hypothetical protein
VKVDQHYCYLEYAEIMYSDGSSKNMWIKLGITVNNKFNTICIFLSYNNIFSDVTVKDALLKVFFFFLNRDHAKLLFSFRFNCDNKQTFEARHVKFA